MSISLKLRRSSTPVLTSLPNFVWDSQKFLRRRTILMLLLAASIPIAAVAQSNPGDPLFCQPNEGTSFLIVNGGSGIFTVDPDCFGNLIANDIQNTISTTQGGTLTNIASSGNYRYTPPTSHFVGLDTFSIDVTTVFNGAGGPGSAGGSARPGGGASLTITLNVIPAFVVLPLHPGASNASLVVPAGAITGCAAQGNAGAGPPASAVSGCITGIIRGAGNIAPQHGALSTSGNTLVYTPNTTYAGIDTFTYQAVGVNTDGTNALNSGNVTVQVTGVPPGTPAPPTWVLLAIGVGALGLLEAWRRNRQANLQT